MRRHLPAFVAGIAVAVAASAGVAFATGLVSTDAASTINACVNNTNGLVRIVPDATSCRAEETATSWSSTGSEGGPRGYALVYLGAFDPDRTTASVLGLTSVVTTTYNAQFNQTQKTRYYCFDLSFVPANAMAASVAFPPTSSYTSSTSVVLTGMPNYPTGICPDGTDALMATSASSAPGDTLPSDPPQSSFFIQFN